MSSRIWGVVLFLVALVAQGCQSLNDSPTPFQFKLLARGENLSNRPGGLPPLPFPLPVRVQLQVRDGLCWQAEFSTATTNTTFRFRARSD